MKRLGNSDIQVSSIGLGTVKLGRNEGVRYPEAFELPSDKAVQELLTLAEELEINLLDTAPAYGNSEERLGKWLRNRNRWVICTKVGEIFENGKSYFDFSARGIELSIERSLRRLKTDYLDIVLVHSNGEDVKIIEEESVFESLQKLKTQGKLRAFGMSTKTVEGGLLAVEHSDVVMVTYNPLETTERTVITHAHTKKKGVFIKKALASGHVDKISMTDPVREAFQFIFKEPGVSSVIVGTLNPEHLRYDVLCAKSASRVE